MRKWFVRSAFILLAAGVIALGAVSLHFYQQTRSCREKLAAEYQVNWSQLWKVTDLAAGLYGENEITPKEQDVSVVWQYAAMTMNSGLCLPPHIQMDALDFENLVRVHYLNLVDDLDDPEREDAAMPLFREMNRDLCELSRDMAKRYLDVEMLDPDSGAYRETEAKIRAFIDEYTEPLSEYFGYELA